MKYTVILYGIFFILATSISGDAFSDDYYWINGTGDWSDLNHWSQTSGGSVLHINVPGPLDNVFFDDNSFISSGTVNITAENATCHDMAFVNNNAQITISSSPDVTLRIYGSLTFSENVTNSISGPVEFRAEEEVSINTAGKTLLSSVFFLGENGIWNLSSDIETMASIYFTQGTLISNNFLVSCVTFSSIKTNNRVLDLGTSQINVEKWDITTENLTLNAGQTHITAKHSVSTSNDLK